MVITTIAVSEKTKYELNKLKIHPREPYEDVIKRILKEVKNGK